MKNTHLPIFDETLVVPVLKTQGLTAVHARAAMCLNEVETGCAVQAPIFQLIPRRKRRLSLFERYQSALELETHFQSVIFELHIGRIVYEGFLAEILEATRRGSAEFMRSLCKAASEFEIVAQATPDDAQRVGTQLAQEELRESLRLMAVGVLTLLKKVELCQKALAHLCADERLQERVLDDIARVVHLQVRFELAKEEASRLRKQALEMANTAETFNDTMRSTFGALQYIIDRVCVVDEGLQSLVAEIDALGAVLSSNDCTSLEEACDPVVENLVRIITRRGSLEAALDDVLEGGAEVRFDVEMELDDQCSIDASASAVAELIARRVEQVGGRLGMRPAPASNPEQLSPLESQ
ncbi:MAG: hypothetical protein AUK47_00175 [Deltaproteobacteria bacterium CG2_30_63_29]|nr:MAG: hypothetical protein AUK47_00175 [Deltaproteobacteria bacterium CG2_30_63_29]PJB33275.1 MAG: hypothetical protein CO108_31240 [Deltaproteobacteria bacterium CG_4_9_14_3_um_filter_63_12]